MSNRPEITVMSKKELAKCYGIPPRSFYSLFKPHEAVIGKKCGRYFSIRQVISTFDLIGWPDCMLPDEFRNNLPSHVKLYQPINKN